MRYLALIPLLFACGTAEGEVHTYDQSRDAAPLDSGAGGLTMGTSGAPGSGGAVPNTGGYHATGGVRASGGVSTSAGGSNAGGAPGSGGSTLGSGGSSPKGPRPGVQHGECASGSMGEVTNFAVFNVCTCKISARIYSGGCIKWTESIGSGMIDGSVCQALGGDCIAADTLILAQCC